MAATISRKKLSALTCGNSGASSTPANPANSPESIHDSEPTRLAFTPASSVIRGLSTTARMRRPAAVRRSSALNRPTARNVTTIVVSSSRLTAYSPKR